MEWGGERGGRASSQGPNPYSILPSSVYLLLLNLSTTLVLPRPTCSALLPRSISAVPIPELRTPLH